MLIIYPGASPERLGEYTFVSSNNCHVIQYFYISKHAQKGILLTTMKLSLMSLISVWGVFLLFLSQSQASNDEIKVEVLYKPRICMKKSQTNNMLKVQYKVFFENGTLFHSRYCLKVK